MTQPIYIPTTKPGDWQQLLAEPEKHWRPGYSAYALAHCWQTADGLPESVRAAVERSDLPSLRGLEVLLALPEHKVPLPGGSRPSQTDLFALLRNAKGELVATAVEGKVDEPFGPTVADWRAEASPGKEERLAFLLETLGLPDPPRIGEIRYQLLHRTASALIEAGRFNAEIAFMLVHSFSQDSESFADYADFAVLFGATAERDSVVSAGVVGGVELLLGWVTGEARFLEEVPA